jgi:hypothetical protein
MAARDWVPALHKNGQGQCAMLTIRDHGAPIRGSVENRVL